MPAPRHHRDLDVWRTAIELVEAVYRLSAKFPDDEKFGLTSQIRRAAVSIPANIAEGAGRDGARELLRYLSIARGSLAEMDTHLTLSVRLGLVESEEIQPVNLLGSRVAQMLTKLKQSIGT